MREKPRDPGRLEHILQSIANIEEFLKDKSAEDFLLDKNQIREYLKEEEAEE
ncbi:MAG: hypothetical protein HDS14_05540 [Bacteroides sp.]|nr:hypothetical protein [Bacteroides sp.]